jgi:Fe-S-cluster containining protein
MVQLKANQVAREVKGIYKKTDAAMKKVSKVCQQGCVHCCLRSIRIHLAEETVIGTYVKEKLSAENQEMIRKKLQRWFEFFNDATPQRTLTISDMLKLDQQVAKSRMECPFLILSECSIYPVRPLVCRTHTVNDSPDLCGANPVRPGDVRGIKLQERGFKDMEIISGMNGFSLLTYATAEHFEIHGPFRGLDWSVIDTSSSGK